ncbi:MAG TPA: hypothetical protein VD828_01300 [Candidatus Nitrosotenuis sp.]|nr:hypothetical protein [Candidatus Nitrosotenuis sp.]
MEKQILPYCIPLEDYPKLLRYRVTQQGFYHIEDLVSEIYLEGKKAPMHKLISLGILLRVNMCQTMNEENESLYQDVSDKAKRFGGVEPAYLSQCIKTLVLRGLLESNPKYDRQLALDLYRQSDLDSV